MALLYYCLYPANECNSSHLWASEGLCIHKRADSSFFRNVMPPCKGCGWLPSSDSKEPCVNLYPPTMLTDMKDVKKLVGPNEKDWEKTIVRVMEKEMLKPQIIVTGTTQSRCSLNYNIISLIHPFIQASITKQWLATIFYSAAITVGDVTLLGMLSSGNL